MMRLSVDLWLNLPSRPCVPKPMSLLPLTHVGRGRKTVNGRGTQHITCVTPDVRLRVVGSQTQRGKSLSLYPDSRLELERN